MPPKSNRITSDEKPVVSFRMSFRLTAWLKDVASKRAWSMNEYVVSALEGLQRMWGFPAMMADVLEADRKAMGLDEFDYVGHLLGAATTRSAIRADRASRRRPSASRRGGIMGGPGLSPRSPRICASRARGFITVPPPGSCPVSTLARFSGSIRNRSCVRARRCTKCWRRVWRREGMSHGERLRKSRQVVSAPQGARRTLARSGLDRAE